MPIINVNNCDYFYEIHGTRGETMVFAHGILWNGAIFHKQIDYFKSKYTVIVFDFRGHGRSEVTNDGYQIENVVEDIVQLLKYLNLKKVHFIGLSMGADIAMRLAIKRPDFIKSLILIGATASPEANKIKYKLLNSIIKFSGIKTVLEPILMNMFGNEFLNSSKNKNELENWKGELLKNKKTIYKSISAGINRTIIKEERLKTISCPTLILVGEDDRSIPIEKSEYIHSKIKSSILILIEESGHMLCIEKPEECNKHIEQFVNQIDM